jgi:tetratricopeptide (TPR) repeat protein
MRSPGGWIEPGQTPEFEEFTLVLKGMLRVARRGGTLEVRAGQAVVAHAGEWVQYSTPSRRGPSISPSACPLFRPRRSIGTPPLRPEQAEGLIDMAHKQEHEPGIPAPAQSAYEAILALTDTFCREHLNAEYEVLCHRLAEKLARKRPSPLLGGKPKTWACGIVRTIGWVNFLDDSSQTPHLKMAAIDKAFGVGESTGQGKSKAIRTLLQMRPFDPEWTLPSRMGQNPMAWMIQVNGVLVDARRMPREVQEVAYRKGLIPFLPGEGAEGSVDENGNAGQEAEPEDLSGTAAADAACLVGEMHLAKGEYEKAIQAFTQAITGNPTADAYEGRANAYRALGERDQRQALEHRPPR